MTLEELVLNCTNLDEHITYKKREVDVCRENASAATYIYKVEELALLEELKVLRVELEKNSKELKVYKKAFEMGCDDWGEFCCSQTMLKHRCDSDCAKHWKDYYLQKARKE